MNHPHNLRIGSTGICYDSIETIIKRPITDEDKLLGRDGLFKHADNTLP